MTYVIPKKFCPFMSNATETKLCDRDCKLLITCPNSELKCAFELIAIGATRKG